jgi:hypothetical protein
MKDQPEYLHQYTRPRRGMPVSARYMRGQSMVEYFIVTSFTVLILIQGADSSVIQSLVTAMKDAYAGFTYALGYATTLTGF